uniref:DUF148 domain-containing protein n=1 Tax=Steinernema glaseri TaxID=37863 RepID=A0A1I7YUL3_9BILA
MPSLRLVIFVAFFGLCAAQKLAGPKQIPQPQPQQLSKLETFLKNMEKGVPKERNDYKTYRNYYPSYGYPVLPYPILPGAIVEQKPQDTDSRIYFLEAQLDAAHKHIEALKKAHANHDQAHQSIVERLEAQIVAGRKKHAELEENIAGMKATIETMQRRADIDFDLIRQLAQIIITFEDQSRELTNEVFELQDKLVSAEEHHSAQLSAFKNVLNMATTLIGKFEIEHEKAHKDAMILSQDYKIKKKPLELAAKLVDYYKKLGEKEDEGKEVKNSYYTELSNLVAPIR